MLLKSMRIRVLGITSFVFVWTLPYTHSFLSRWHALFLCCVVIFTNLSISSFSCSPSNNNSYMRVCSCRKRTRPMICKASSFPLSLQSLYPTATLIPTKSAFSQWWHRAYHIWSVTFGIQAKGRIKSSYPSRYRNKKVRTSLLSASFEFRQLKSAHAGAYMIHIHICIYIHVYIHACMHTYIHEYMRILFSAKTVKTFFHLYFPIFFAHQIAKP